MTQILLTPLIQEAAGGVRTAARLTARPTFDTDVDQDRVTFAQTLTWNFDGMNLPIITLEEPRPNTAWVLELTAGARSITRTVTFTGTQARWDELVDVDPATITPVPSGPALAAWVAVRDQLLTIARTPGPPGRPGDRGPQGIPGDRGPQGDVGPAGQGEQGEQGEPGVKGDTGAKGDTGPQGIQGIAGPVGPAGLTWRGTYNGANDYAKDDAVYYDGASWFAAADPTPGETPGTTSSWAPLAIRGAQGIQGVQGVKGDPGDTGPKGDTGAQGIKGDTGAQGIQGVKGDAGAQGIQGVKGDAGAQGIQGVKGDTGSQGVKGDTGATGPSALPDMGTLTGSTDLNTLTAKGIYRISANFKTSNNGLDSAYQYGVLLVHNVGVAVMQTYYEDSTSMYRRQAWNGGNFTGHSWFKHVGTATSS